MNITSYFDLSQQKPWDAAHLAVQSAVAASAAFVLMRALGLEEAFVAVLSAVLVIQPSVGNTLAEAGDRVAATIVGSIAGITCLFLLPSGYGTAISLAITMLVINALAGFRPDWRYGVVAGVALALGSEHNVMETAQARALAIALGAFTGVAVSLVVWPDTASKRASRHINTALLAAADLLDQLIAPDNEETGRKIEAAHAQFNAGIASAREAAAGIQWADGTAIDQRISQTDRLYKSLIFIQRANAARQEAGVEENRELSKAIDVIRKEAKEAVCFLAEDGHLRDGELSDVKEALEEAKKLPRTEERLDTLTDNALVFALSEVTLSLRNLKRAFDEEYQGSMLDWGAKAHSTVRSSVGRMAPWS